MKIRTVISALEQFAPLPLQESYDNAGLQVGLPEAEASGALLCLDVTEAVLQEAIDLGCNLILAHHPLLFHPLRSLSDATLQERCVRMAVENGLTVYAAHTNLDAAEDGVNYKMAEKLGLIDVCLLSERTVSLPSREVKAGSGILGRLPEAEDALVFLERVKTVFRVECLETNELLQRPIQSVALVGGAGDFMLSEAVRHEADAFLTGEVHYHTWFGYDGRIQIAALGHYQSEQYTTEIFASLLASLDPRLPVFTAQTLTNPIHYL